MSVILAILTFAVGAALLLVVIIALLAFVRTIFNVDETSDLFK